MIDSQRNSQKDKISVKEELCARSIASYNNIFININWLLVRNEVCSPIWTITDRVTTSKIGAITRNALPKR